MPIRDLARDEIVSVGPETPVLDVARRMRDENVGSVVVTNDDVPAGIVTDRDLTTRVLAEAMEADGHTADDVMSTNVCAVGPDAGVYEALEVMSENGVRRLPICGENDEIEGIVTADDLLELLADESRQLASVIQTQRPGY
ncbi:CBS domain-containing protein [Halobaculum sp. MBLA0147]|uniref:CBS domain-containing protein n=1 Tax=Halobaculum sp. MBLA0147 TaxID=3079934 RepID=UPI003525D32B